MRPITTDGDPIAAASCARPGQITLSRTSPGSGSSAGRFSAASSANASGPHRSPVQDRWPSSGTPHAEIAAILNTRGLTSGEGRPFHQLIIRNIRDDYQLRSREQRLRDAGNLTLAEIAAQLGVSTGTIKTWHHAGLLTGHPYNDKGQCLYPPPGPNPPARAKGRKLSQRRPAAPADDA